MAAPGGVAFFMTVKVMFTGSKIQRSKVLWFSVDKFVKS
jgi:hypothetical protein